MGSMPQKFGFDANNEIIPNQTILREKNQQQTMTQLGVKSC